MGNMSYCKFENTFSDLLDCNFDESEDELSQSEVKARRCLIAKCVDIAIDYGYEIGRECEEV